MEFNYSYRVFLIYKYLQIAKLCFGLNKIAFSPKFGDNDKKIFKN